MNDLADVIMGVTRLPGQPIMAPQTPAVNLPNPEHLASAERFLRARGFTPGGGPEGFLAALKDVMSKGGIR